MEKSTKDEGSFFKTLTIYIPLLVEGVAQSGGVVGSR